ncbi:endospore germination permease [Alkalicella caledoniensis]|uniref:Endospore germination permease n=1 Tax=Alkalicella caledoniensis TaxID=2731377 RepID=A0A7G9W7T5_ALKCA|nr:endospore germination permease [Alkalicella caledoniensis]QNO14747.1 endospore germination permease [Alkalicella caledoniensis]
MSNNIPKKIISYRQIFFLTVGQLGGAAILYMPGTIEAGRNVWISFIIASLIGYIVVYLLYLPLSLNPGKSVTEVLNEYWPKPISILVNLYYLFFLYILCLLVLSDVYYFGKITMPETPGYVFMIFLLVPSIYAVKLGLETIARFSEFVVPILAILFLGLYALALQQKEFVNLLPIMADGIKPVIAGAIPNMNFPFAQILPIAFLYQYVPQDNPKETRYLKTTFLAIFAGTLLLAISRVVTVGTFSEDFLKVMVFPQFSTIRVIELGDFIERLDFIFLAIFYATTFLKFVITYYVINQILSNLLNIKELKSTSLPIAVLLAVAMPLCIPRFDVVVNSVVPYFIISIPLLFIVPILLLITVKIKDKNKKN